MAVALFSSAWLLLMMLLLVSDSMLATASAFVHRSSSSSSSSMRTTHQRVQTPLAPSSSSSPSQAQARPSNACILFALEPVSGKVNAVESIAPASSVMINNLSSNIVGSISSSSSSSNTDDGDFSFFDEASIYIRAGSGGQGASTYKKAKKGANGIPDGGSGGLGGNVYLKLDESLNTLAGLNRNALRPNAFGGGGAAASSKRMGHKGGNGGSVNETPIEERTNANNFVVRERLLSFRAADGRPGGRMYDNGRGGEDCEVLVPPGTVVRLEVPRYKEEVDGDGGGDDTATATATAGTSRDSDEGIDDEDEIEYDLIELGTVSFESPSLLVARGGTGGEGTLVLRGKKKGATRRGPSGGERGRLRLTLKIVADIALVGVPNAGKSTFLASVTRAKPRIADYPFTTVVPNLGTWIPVDPSEENSNGNQDYQKYKKGSSRDKNSNNKASSSSRDKTNQKAAGANGLVLCDVPGLIAGASEGVGLGHAFLRHIERCRVILHLVDATSADPVGDFAMVNDELKRYGSGSLSEKPQVVIVNKIDAAFGAEQSEYEDDYLQERDGDDEVLETTTTRAADLLKAELAAKMKDEMGHTRLMWVSAKEKDGVDDLMRRMASYVGNMKEEEQQKQQAQEEEDATPVAL